MDGRGSEEGKEDGEFFDQATMRRRPSDLLVGVWNPALIL
jgi:hypothetical protein